MHPARIVLTRSLDRRPSGAQSEQRTAARLQHRLFPRRSKEHSRLGDRDQTGALAGGLSRQMGHGRPPLQRANAVDHDRTAATNARRLSPHRLPTSRAALAGVFGSCSRQGVETPSVSASRRTRACLRSASRGPHCPFRRRANLKSRCCAAPAAPARACGSRSLLGDRKPVVAELFSTHFGLPPKVGRWSRPPPQCNPTICSRPDNYPFPREALTDSKALCYARGRRPAPVAPDGTVEGGVMATNTIARGGASRKSAPNPCPKHQSRGPQQFAPPGAGRFPHFPRGHRVRRRGLHGDRHCRRGDDHQRAADALLLSGRCRRRPSWAALPRSASTNSPAGARPGNKTCTGSTSST